MALTHAQAEALVREADLNGPAHGDFDRVKELIESHPSLVEALNALDPSQMDETPQGAAAHCGRREILEYLLAQGVRLDIFMACALGMTDRVSQFLQADPTLARARGAHQIPILCHVSDRRTAELLLAYGADPNAGEEADWTPLFDAAAKGRTEVTELLILHGANVRSLAPGTKPLHHAAANGHQEMVALLLRHGASVNARAKGRTWGGKTPLTLALENAHPRIADLLRQYGGAE
jgi:ankyrin repeat protein